MADTTTGSAQDKPRRKPTTPPATDTAAQAEEPKPTTLARDASDSATDPADAGWLRYAGQAPLVFMDLGGEVEPGQVVHPRNQALHDGLLARGDFEPADPPAPDNADSPQ